MIRRLSWRGRFPELQPVVYHRESGGYERSDPAYCTVPQEDEEREKREEEMRERMKKEHKKSIEVSVGDKRYLGA